MRALPESSDDGSVLGQKPSYLRGFTRDSAISAALVIYGGLANASQSGLPARLQLQNGRTVEVSPREASIAQAAAAEALR